MHRFAFASIVVGSLIAVGCGAQGDAVPERVDTAQQPIFHGQPDATHTAVVAVFSQQGECSGTIIAVQGNLGIVLTAAHCCDAADPPVQVVMGADFNNPTAQFNVVANSVTPDPGYNGNSDHDYCLLKFKGASANTPIIPAMTPAQDTLKLGDMVQFVGYGITENNQMNSQRRQVWDDLGPQKPTAGTLFYDQQPGGPCSGDSGGPALFTVGGQELVCGVTSQGDGACVQYGESGRVSHVYNSFIAPYLGGMPQMDCNSCVSGAQTGACSGQFNGCNANGECVKLSSCVNACKDKACQDACYGAHPNGEAALTAYYDCICGNACTQLCQAECKQIPTPPMTTSSSTGTTTSTSSGAGGGSSSGPGAGGGAATTGTGAGAGGQKSNPDDTATDSGCSCSTEGSPASPSGAYGLAFVALAIASRRRRRS